jgi:hypothetical protein
MDSGARILSLTAITLSEGDISLCNLCDALCLCGEFTAKTFTTEAQRFHREPQRPAFSDRLLKAAVKANSNPGGTGRTSESNNTQGGMELVTEKRASVVSVVCGSP